MEDFKWNVPEQRLQGPPTDCEFAIVDLPVKVIFEHSDRIVVDVDENDNPIEFTSGYIMRVLPDQRFVYNDHKRRTIGVAFKK